MIKVFSPNDTVFTSIGNKVLAPKSCLETKVIDDEWSLKVELSMAYINYVQQDSIIVAPTKYGMQPFRIKNINAKKRITFTADHICFDSKNFIIDSLTTTGLTAQNCLNAVLAATTDSNHFTAWSDITVTKTLTFTKCSLWDAILAIQEAYGGFIDFNGWQIRLSSTLGADRGLVFEPGKNLISAELTEDWKDVCTTVLPIGNNNIELTPKTRSSATVYDRPYTKVIKFNADDTATLEAKALEHLDNNSTPKINCKVEAVITNSGLNTYGYLEGFTYGDLESYTYGDLDDAVIEQYYKLNDVVVVKSRQFNATANIIGYTYNILTQRTKTVEFGNYIRTVKRAFSAINDTLESIKNRENELTTIIALQTELINNAGTYGYCIKTENEIYFVDTIPMSSATFVMRLNVAGLGFSSTGVDGPYTNAWTLDGHLNASFINGLTITGVKIETTEDMEVGKVLQLTKVVPTTITELVQMRLGKYGIHFGEDVDGSGYPYAYMTAYDRSVLAGLGYPYMGMMIHANAEIMLDSAENIITAPAQSRYADGHIYKNVNIEAYDWTEILSFTLQPYTGVRVNVTVGGLQNGVGSFGLVRSMNFKKDNNTPTGAYSDTTEWWGTSNQTSHLRYVITGDDVSIQVRSANANSCIYNGMIEAIGDTV